MFSHTLFSLPFALAAMLIAAGRIPDAATIFWVVLAFTGARNGANALNRIIDRKIDRKNPRTAGRHLAEGSLSLAGAMLFAGVCFLLLLAAAIALGPLCLVLLPIPMLLFVLYSYTKRFTWLCHLILGATCAGASFGGWMAATGEIELNTFILSAANALWVAGFDVIYSLQDYDFDRREGLHSIPVHFGLNGALGLSALMHAAVPLLLLYSGALAGLQAPYFWGVGVISLLLAAEHLMVLPGKLDWVPLAAYSMNKLIGPLFLLFSGLGVLI